MLYALKNGKAVPVEHSASLNENADEYYISVNKLDSQNPKLQFNTVSSAMLSKIVLNSTPRFESHDKLDVICINMSNVFTNAHRGVSFPSFTIHFNKGRVQVSNPNLNPKPACSAETGFIFNEHDYRPE